MPLLLDALPNLGTLLDLGPGAAALQLESMQQGPEAFP